MLSFKQQENFLVEDELSSCVLAWDDYNFLSTNYKNVLTKKSSFNVIKCREKNSVNQKLFNFSVKQKLSAYLAKSGKKIKASKALNISFYFFISLIFKNKEKNKKKYKEYDQFFSLVSTTTRFLNFNSFLSWILDTFTFFFFF